MLARDFCILCGFSAIFASVVLKTPASLPEPAKDGREEAAPDMFSMDFTPLSAFNNQVANVMTMNAVRASSKTRQKTRRYLNLRMWVLAPLAILVGVASVFGYDYYSGSLGLIGPQFEIVENSRNRIIKVPPGGNLQGAIDAAKSGDIVELQAGAVYSGQINLPN